MQLPVDVFAQIGRVVGEESDGGHGKRGTSDALVTYTMAMVGLAVAIAVVGCGLWTVGGSELAALREGGFSSNPEWNSILRQNANSG
jgi:hypothetical protein